MAGSVEEDLVSGWPEFPAITQAERHMWVDEYGDTTPCGALMMFSGFVAARLAKREVQGLNAVFEYAERQMNGNDPIIRDAVATCFLENLMNLVPSSIDPDLFVPLLGPKSREYCRGWDEFTGIKTKGLW